jgi:hypothetical protein
MTLLGDGNAHREEVDTEQKPKQKPSRFGITSIILCAIGLVTYYALFWGSFYFGGGSLIGIIFEHPTLILLTCLFSVVTLGLGILGLFEKDRNRLFASIGIVASMLLLFAEVFGYCLIKLMLSVPW